MIEKVKSLKHLKGLISKEKHDFFIQLNFNIRSSKRIIHDKEGWEIYHEIDDTFTNHSEEDFKTTFVYDALVQGALYCYN